MYKIIYFYDYNDLKPMLFHIRINFLSIFHSDLMVKKAIIGDGSTKMIKFKFGKKAAKLDP